MNRPEQKYFGKYRGKVTSVDDPLKQGRIQAMVPAIFGKEQSGWALPCFAMAGSKAGIFAIPPVGAGVWIEFESGDPEYPIWTGCFYGMEIDVPLEERMMPDKKLLLRTPGGTQLVLDDSPGNPTVLLKTSAGDKIEISAQGIVIRAATGAKLTIGAAGIEINSGQGAAIKLSGPKVDINNGALEVL